MLADAGYNKALWISIEHAQTRKKISFSEKKKKTVETAYNTDRCAILSYRALSLSLSQISSFSIPFPFRFLIKLPPLPSLFTTHSHKISLYSPPPPTQAPHPPNPKLLIHLSANKSLLTPPSLHLRSSFFVFLHFISKKRTTCIPNSSPFLFNLSFSNLRRIPSHPIPSHLDSTSLKLLRFSRGVFSLFLS